MSKFLFNSRLVLQSPTDMYRYQLICYQYQSIQRDLVLKKTTNTVTYLFFFRAQLSLNSPKVQRINCKIFFHPSIHPFHIYQYLITSLELTGEMFVYWSLELFKLLDIGIGSKSLMSERDTDW